MVDLSKTGARNGSSPGQKDKTPSTGSHQYTRNGLGVVVLCLLPLSQCCCCNACCLIQMLLLSCAASAGASQLWLTTLRLPSRHTSSVHAARVTSHCCLYRSFSHTAVHKCPLSRWSHRCSSLPCTGFLTAYDAASLTASSLCTLAMCTVSNQKDVPHAALVHVG